MVSELVDEIISITKRRAFVKETTIQFKPEIFSETFQEDDVKTGIKNYILTNELVDSDRNIIQGFIDDAVFIIYDISEETQDYIYDNLSEDLSEHPHIINAGKVDDSVGEFRSEIQSKKVSEEEYWDLVKSIEQEDSEDIRELSERLEISPYTVALASHKHNLYSVDQKRDAVSRLLSYFIGCAMGQWNCDNIDPIDDGIIVVDDGFDEGIMSYIRDCIELMYGENGMYERESEIENILNRDISDWLRNRFFRYHHCKEYRRRGQRNPIYWHLESDEGAFSCFIYYHSMDADTFPKLRGQYIDEKLDTLQNRLEAIESELEAADEDRARDLRSEKEEVEADIDDITEFRDSIDDLIDEGFEPDFEAGIWENIQKVDEHDLLAVPLDKL